MLKKLALFVNSIENVGMAVTAGDSDNSSKGIKVSPTTLIKQVLHLPFHDVKRLLVEMEKRRSQKLLPFLENFFGGGTIIRPRLVIERRNLRRRGGGGETRAEDGDGRAGGSARDKIKEILQVAFSVINT